MSKRCTKFICCLLYTSDRCRRIERCPSRGLGDVYKRQKLSDAAKQITNSELRTWYILQVLLNYVETMHKIYMDQHKNDAGLKEFKAQIPDKSYYSFLKYFNFNDPSYLSSSSYSKIFESLLNNEIMAIPAIGEMSVDAWLIKVKEILKDDIGSDTGI